MVSLNPLSAIDVCVIISRIGSELEQWPFKGPFPFPSSVLHVVHIRQLAIKLHIFISILFQALSPAYNYDNLACAIMQVYLHNTVLHIAHHFQRISLPSCYCFTLSFGNHVLL